LYAFFFTEILLFQDAKKGVLFIDFPPVLQLQLKRFEYDFMRDTMVKVCISALISFPFNQSMLSEALFRGKF
jgi:hypothetical protein